METLTPEQIGKEIIEIPQWFADETDTTIARTFTFDDFQTAIIFVNKVAGIAERERHHPNIHVHNYNRVTISLTTHEAGGLTTEDFSLAAKIDKILS
ncbi:4a-hydroxytetrahydrobiopterin dehydratase [Candidatus Peribacteria bacterium]|nr:4a-hydroxytetrahydrobiopterin dehydratase [Candidatus Peribacteria bacterium]